MAVQLLQGIAVIPESFENVTVGFTDIVGFQNMVVRLMPIEVGKIMLDRFVKTIIINKFLFTLRMDQKCILL